MANPLRDKAAIVGVGVTEQALSNKIRGIPGWTARELQIEAFKRAINDAGLKKEQIDGLMTQGQVNDYITLGQSLGINQRYGGSMSGGGSTGGLLVGAASMAVNAGLAKYVALVYANGNPVGGTRRARGEAADEPQEGGDDPIPWSTWGLLSALARSATSAQRHMVLYGLKSEQLGEVAVAQRAHAVMDPTAIMQKPITIEDHQESRWIVEPLHLLDCCLVSSGGVCLIVTTKERAKDLAKPPANILGFGQGFTTQNLERKNWFAGPHQRDSVQRAYAMAGVSPMDIDVAQIYDNFSITVIMQLEHAGFCGVGEGGEFVEGGRIGPGGAFPVNTNGGHLSHSHPAGFLTIAEGVRQIRGECGPRQVENAKIALTMGRGMNLNAASALVLTNQT